MIVNGKFASKIIKNGQTICRIFDFLIFLQKTLRNITWSLDGELRQTI